MHDLQAVKGIVILLLGYCCYTDLKDNRVHNSVVILILILQLVYMLGTYKWAGLTQFFAGILTVSPLYLLYAFGMLGAGDVKLLMALSAGLGAVLTLRLLMFSLIVGGLMAVFVMLWRNILMQRLKKLLCYCISVVLTCKLTLYHEGDLHKDGQMPLVPAIALGYMLVVVGI